MLDRFDWGQLYDDVRLELDLSPSQVLALVAMLPPAYTSHPAPSTSQVPPTPEGTTHRDDNYKELGENLDEAFVVNFMREALLADTWNFHAKVNDVAMKTVIKLAIYTGTINELRAMLRGAGDYERR